MVYKFFDKKSQVKGLASNKENLPLADELHNPIIKKLKKEKCILHLKTIFGCRFGRYAVIK